MHCSNNASQDDAAQAALTQLVPTTDVPAEAVRNERSSNNPSAATTRCQRRRNNRKASGDTSKLTQEGATRRVTKDRGEFLTLLHVIHLVARQDTHQWVVPGHPFGFWETPEVSEDERTSMKALGNYLRDNFPTATRRRSNCNGESIISWTTTEISSPDWKKVLRSWSKKGKGG